ncbi:hypothetical protein HPB47_016673 [Ixodes persulcatus]|uniref:Uncharacterized protein n=1 Tax=Ixodes persulcatus TaxID=34615 RepID=A0AC60QRH4_IXOPE|nr:hypothetical protein HPB47_016673 [Ixodes persulcatus]
MLSMLDLCCIDLEKCTDCFPEITLVIQLVLRIIESVQKPVDFRNYPPGSPHPTERHAGSEKELDAGCVKIPAGVSIVIPTYLLHHDPKLWHDPSSFDPERFRPETFEPGDAGAYQPFGAGPRNCFAMAFSKKVIMLLAAKVVAKYRLVLSRADQEQAVTEGLRNSEV